MQTEALKPGTGYLSQQDAQEYLESLQSLTVELNTAMDAVVTRSLPSFEESLDRQKASCARLAELAAHSGSQDGQDTKEPSPVDAELARRITMAAVTLQNLNKSYSALLQHSGDTLRLFAGLFQSYTGPNQQSSVTRVNVPTWSCEL